MSLDDEYSDYLKTPRKCKVCTWLNTQERDIREFFQRRGRDNGKKMAQFAQQKLGMEANETTVRKHFNENHDAVA